MTVINESFNTANSDTLGPDLSWTELAGDIDIVSNKAQSVTLTTQVIARAESELLGPHHYVQAVVDVSEEVASATPGVIARKDSSATLTFYYADLAYNLNQVRLFKVVEGTFTSLITAVSLTLTAGTPIAVRLECQGTTIRVLTAASPFTTFTERISLTDASISTGNFTGIRGAKATSGSVNWDAFEAGDFQVATPTINFSRSKYFHYNG